MAQHTPGGYTDAIYVNLNNTGWSFSHIIFSFFRWCGQIGDTLFIAVSAWLLCDSKLVKVKKPIRMILDSWVLSIIGLMIAFCWMKPLFSEIVKAFLPVRFNLNWFVSCYVIYYYLIHPLLNRAIEGMDKKETKKTRCDSICCVFRCRDFRTSLLLHESGWLYLHSLFCFMLQKIYECQGE